MNMYRDRGVGGSAKGDEMLDRKGISDALDKKLEKSSPSTSRNKGSSISVPITSAAARKHIDNRSSSILKASTAKISSPREKSLALVKNELVPDGREGEDEKGTKKQF